MAASPASAAPGNDAFAGAYVMKPYAHDTFDYLTGGPDYSGATAEAGEPAHAGVAARTSVWFTWTAPSDRKVTMQTSMFDANYGIAHSLAVYTGTSLTTLTEVAADAAGGSDGTWGGGYAGVTFVAEAGRTYKIAIDDRGWNGSYNFSMTTVPANDDFADARTLSGASGSVKGDNRFGSIETGESPSYPTNGASIWYSWVAPRTGAVSVSTAGSALDTLLDVFTGSTVDNVRGVDSNDDCGVSVSTSCVTFPAVSGQTYKIRVDGFSGQVGNTSLSWQACTISGTWDNDLLVGTAGNDVICGMGGDDIIKGQGGNDIIIGGHGKDKVDYANATAGVTVNLTTGTATGQGTDTLEEIEDVDGSPYADRIDGDGNVNWLAGKAGNDNVYGQAGSDKVWGGDGTDTLGGGDGNDQIAGGLGIDTVRYTVPVSVDLTAGTATGQGTDTVKEFENVVGSTGPDRIRGNSLANNLQGGSGADTLLGEGANDKLLGNDGNDSLTGGVGTDACNGGAGTDTAGTCETRISIP